ncbi:MAG: ATP-binding protein, partial [Alsobacter sp.]
KMELEAIPLDPAETADTVLNLFWERAQRKNLDLAASVAPDVPASIIGDPVRLNQVIGNLVNNALKFTESGYVLLSIGRDPHDPSRIRFAITDTGIGIPQDKIDTLFEAFAQVDQTTTRKFGGTGLGLAICKRLVDAMGGSFRVTSEAGRGSTFAFSFPILGPAAPREVPQVEAPGLIARRRAVVAIRGDATARIAADLIASCGYAVERRDADDLASGLPPVDLVVVEGTVLAGLPIPTPALRPRHVIAVTTMGDGAERHLEDGRRCDAALVRPLAHTEMLALLRRVVEGRPLDGAAGQRKARLAAVPQFPGRCVLVADDSAVNREVAVEALSRLGVRAEVVEDGRTAVEAARRGGIDLILMDGSMPDIDGFEASRQIRARETAEGSPRLPIVALTAHVVGSAADLWRDAGMDGILHKPFTIAAMAECLAPFLQQGKGEDGAVFAATVDTVEVSPAPAEAADMAAAPAPEGPPLIDPDVMEQLESMASADGGAFLARILGLYREHAPRTVSDFAACVASGEAEDQAKAAHALKSMSYNVGAARIAAAAGEIERIIRVDGGRVDAGHAAALDALLAKTLAAFAARHPAAFGEPSRISARA